MPGLRNARTGAWLARDLSIARGFWARGRGLMGRGGLAEGSGLMLPHCNSIHSFFMRFPFDALFTDAGWRVVHLIEAMPAWRVSPIVWKAGAVIELPAGVIAASGTGAGDLLELVGAGHPTQR